MKYQTFIDLAKHSALVVLMACATISLSGCDKPESHGAEMPHAMPVVVAPLTSAMVKDAETFVGTLKARKTVVIRPRVEGYITAINVVSGESVGKGAALVEIDTAKQKEALASRLATRESMVDEKLSADENLHALLANRQAKVATLNYQQSQYQRYKGLKAEGAVSQESVDQYFTQLKSAEAELAAIDAQIRGQESMINRSAKMLKESNSQANQERVQLAYHTVGAPFAGVIGDVPVRVGQYVETSTELTTLDQSRPLEVYVNVPAELSTKLKLGLPIELLDGHDQKIGECPITFVSPEVGGESQTVLVKGLYDNMDSKLRSNQQVTCRVVWQKRQRMLVPTNSVVHISGQDFVFVTRPSGGGFIAKQLPVTLGDIHQNGYVVLDGMKSDEKVVVSDVQRLYEGLAIAPTDKVATNSAKATQGNP